MLGQRQCEKWCSTAERVWAFNSIYPIFLVCSPLCPFYSFVSLFLPLLLQQRVLTLLPLFMISSIPLTVLLSFHFSPFCIHPYPAFISIASYYFSFIWPFISPHSTLSPSPSACMCVYLCVCVAVGCLWLFFKQQPRRLDCHNLWS